MRTHKEKLKAICWVLAHSEGMFAPDICSITGLWRSSIYIYLAQLEDANKVYSEDIIVNGLSRRKYWLEPYAVKEILG